MTQMTQMNADFFGGVFLSPAVLDFGCGGQV